MSPLAELLASPAASPFRSYCCGPALPSSPPADVHGSDCNLLDAAAAATPAAPCAAAVGDIGPCSSARVDGAASDASDACALRQSGTSMDCDDPRGDQSPCCPRDAACKPAGLPSLSPATPLPAATDKAAAATAAVGAAPGVLMRTPQLPPAARAVMGLYGAVGGVPCGSPEGIATAASQLIARWGLEDSFYVYDLGEVARLHATWTAALPRVEPFYAVKCNPDPGILAMLDALGAGFDCASVQELEHAAALGVPHSRIIFANPCKRPSDFRYAMDKGIQYTTFDCASELEKIAAGYPSIKCVLRIRCDDTTCKINLGLKYGADPGDDVPHLLALARDLGLQVAGVSFHVGSGAQNVEVYRDAIRRAREAFDLAPSFGFAPLHLLDIGGGFTAPYDPASADLFYRTAAVINGALEEHFPPDCGVRIIAEPGRFFAETSATLFTTVLGSRRSCAAPAATAAAPAVLVGTTAPAGPIAPASGVVFGSYEADTTDYWLSDGTYGSFRIAVAVDGLQPNFSVLRSPLLPAPGPELAAPAPARLRGDSGRDGHVVHASTRLPALREGDFLAFPYAGAYTICSASRFGGGRMTHPIKMYVCSAAATRDLGAMNDPAMRAAFAAAASAAPVPTTARISEDASSK